MKMYSESPVQSEQEDTLHRRPFALHLVRLVMAAPRKSGFTIAVTGPWGSGKTSILNLTAEILKKENIPVVHFDPWLFSSSPELVGAFFAEVAEQLEEWLPAESEASNLPVKMKRYGAALSALGKGLTLASAVALLANPTGEAGLVVHSAALAAKNIGDQVGTLSEAVDATSSALPGQKTPRSLRQTRDELREQLGSWNSKEPIVVLIDDLDRVERKEAREILRLVRLVGDFPNVVYLLAYDQLRLEQVLQDEDSKYLEKIVQTSVEVPAIRKSEMRKIAAQAINDFFKDQAVHEAEQQYMNDVFNFGVVPVLKTMRDLKRVLNHMPLLVGSVGTEVCGADILAMATLKSAAPGLYQRIAQRPSLVLGPEWAFDKDDHDKERVLLRVHLSELGENENVIEELLGRVFPWTKRMGQGPYSDAGLRKSRRVAHRDVLLQFLEHAIPDGRVSTPTVQRSAEQFGTEEFINQLRTLSTSKFIDLMNRLEDYEGDFEPSRIVPGLQAILTRAELLPVDLPGEPRRQDWITAVDRLVLRVFRQLEEGSVRNAAVSEVVLGEAPIVYRRAALKVAGNHPNAGHNLISSTLEKELRDKLGEEFLSLTAKELNSSRRVLDLIWRFDRDGEKRHLKTLLEESRKAFLYFVELASTIHFSRSDVLGTARLSPRPLTNLAKNCDEVWLLEQIRECQQAGHQTDWMDEACEWLGRIVNGENPEDDYQPM